MDASRATHLSGTCSIYQWLAERRGYIAFNPLSGASQELGSAWQTPEPDNPALSPGQVGRLYDEAETPGERLLVVGLAAWGLRPSELAALLEDGRDQILVDVLSVDVVWEVLVEGVPLGVVATDR